MGIKFKKKIKKRKLLFDKSAESNKEKLKAIETPKRPVQDSLKKASEDATVLFTEEAMTKLMFLVMACEKEVGWHGVGRKLEKGKYEIDDIFLYPQTVTSSTIDPDEKEYAQWQMKMVMEDEEKFERLCFHGHSHVNMSTFSSGTDKSLQNDIIEMIQPDDFYIFMIINKNFSCYFKIADREDGVIYETSRTDGGPSVFIDTVNKSLNKLVKSYSELVTEKSYYSNYGKNYYGNYYGKNYGGNKCNNYSDKSKQLTLEELEYEYGYGYGYGGYYGY